MKIIVLAKIVPDTYNDRKLDLETGLLDRNANEQVIDEIDERALEVGLSYADSRPDAEVVVLSMAPSSAAPTLRKALGMGAASVVHVADELLVGADLGLTAEVLAAAIMRTGFDLVITGNLSTDGSGSVLSAMLAERLAVPQASSLTDVAISEGEVRGTYVSDAGIVEVSATLPAIVSITESLPDARIPSFRGIMAAKKKKLETLTAADLGIDPENQTAPRSIMIAIERRPARVAGTKIIDEGDAGEQLAAFLVKNQFA